MELEKHLATHPHNPFLCRVSEKVGTAQGSGHQSHPQCIFLITGQTPLGYGLQLPLFLHSGDVPGSKSYAFWQQTATTSQIPPICVQA